MRQKIKVVICINDFLVGGAQRMLAGMVRRLDRTRFEPVLVTLFYWEGKEYFYDLLPTDVPIHKLSFKGFWDVRSWITLYRRLRSVNPDIVLSNLFFSNTVTRVLKPLFRYEVAIVEHNTYVNKTKLHQIADRVLSRVTARIVAVSNTVAEFTSKQEHIPREKFIVINNGIDVERLHGECERTDKVQVRREFNIPPHARVILSVARLTTQKNPRLLLQGFARFARNNPNYVLLIVGGSKKWEAIIRNLAANEGVGDKVYLAGLRKDVARFYSIADMFISTSDIEGFGIAHAEALACGVPVLSTKTAGPDEMIQEGNNGYFISGSTPQAVAEGLEKMTRADLSAMRENAKVSVKKYDIERTTAAYERLFAELAEH